MTWPFGALTPLSYRVILVDPPWQYVMRSAKGEKKSPSAHYDCLSEAELTSMPVHHLAMDSCVLVMWSTFPHLGQAHALMKAWGFEYKTGGVWAKRSSTDNGWSFGTGYHLRSAAEPFLIGTIGSPKIVSRSQRNLIVAPVREHSRKPDAMHTLLEALYEGPYCELFGREQRPGWDVWGNESDKFTTVPLMTQGERHD